MSQVTEHLVFLNEYDRRFARCLETADGIMKTLDNNAETMEAQTPEGYTISEDVTLRLLSLQQELSNISTDLCKALVGHARRVREEYE